MNYYLVPKRWSSFDHYIFKLLNHSIESNDITPDNSLMPERCHTSMGEPICSCGAYFLIWEIEETLGKSQGTDGSNR